MAKVQRGNNLVGMVLRAFRLRFNNAPAHGCFIRVQDAPGGLWAVEVVPRDVKFLTHGSGEYRVGGNGDELMDSSPALRNVRNPMQCRTLLMNDAGEIVTTP